MIHSPSRCTCAASVSHVRGDYFFHYVAVFNKTQPLLPCLLCIHNINGEKSNLEICAFTSSRHHSQRSSQTQNYCNELWPDDVTSHKIIATYLAHKKYEVIHCSFRCCHVLLILMFCNSKIKRCWNILTPIIFSKCQKSNQDAKEAFQLWSKYNTRNWLFTTSWNLLFNGFNFQSKSNGTRSYVKVTDRWLFGKHLCFIWLRWIMIIILCSGSGELELKCMLYHLALP